MPRGSSSNAALSSGPAGPAPTPTNGGRPRPAPGRRAERKAQQVGLGLLGDAGATVAGREPAAVEVDGLDRHLAELDPPRAAERPARVENVSALHSAGGRLRKPRR